MKELFKIADRFKSKLSLLNIICLYITIAFSFSKIKKSIFNNNIITDSGISTFVGCMKMSDLILDYEISPMFDWITSNDGVNIISIKSNPVRIVMSCGDNLPYRYDLYVLNSTGTRETHIDRNITNIGLDSMSSNIYDSNVYGIIKAYINGSIDIIKDAWIDLVNDMTKEWAIQTCKNIKRKCIDIYTNTKNNIIKGYKSLKSNVSSFKTKLFQLVKNREFVFYYD